MKNTQETQTRRTSRWRKFGASALLGLACLSGAAALPAGTLPIGTDDAEALRLGRCDRQTYVGSTYRNGWRYRWYTSNNCGYTWTASYYG